MTQSKELLKYTSDLKLLFVEDHKELRESTTEILKNFFHTVESKEDGKAALEAYKANSYDIVLTDIRMPNLDGIELTKKIYEINPKQTIIVLSAHDESSYLIPLINLGVSHFIKKPIDYKELLDALLKVSKSLTDNSYISEKTPVELLFDNNYRYDRENRIMHQEEKVIYLTKYELIFMDLLTGKTNKIFSNEDIVNYYLEQDEDIDPQNIRKLVSKLRKKIPANAIESIYGVGYRVISKA